MNNAFRTYEFPPLAQPPQLPMRAVKSFMALFLYTLCLRFMKGFIIAALMLLFVSVLFIRSLRSSKPPLSFYSYRKANTAKKYSNRKRFPYLKNKGSIRESGKTFRLGLHP